MKIVIVGQGILGLSLAEFFSRDKSALVQVVSSRLHPAASRAAAANLATKAQVFARDPHFALKLQGKELYRDWLVNLRTELLQSDPSDLSGLYSVGLGRDVFSREDKCAEQWRRVLQDPEVIHTRGLLPQKIKRTCPYVIEYGDEAWVHANELLSMLEGVCRSRGVVFSDADVTDFEQWTELAAGASSLVLAAGSQTPRIVQAWSCPDGSNLFKKTRRWSYGGTLEIEYPNWTMPEGVSLLEIVRSDDPIGKITFSGSRSKLFCSSISVKCNDRGFSHPPENFDAEQVELQKSYLCRIVSETFSFAAEDFPHRFHWGLRLGFGHSELFVEPLPMSEQLKALGLKSLIVAAGAHKSGFLFAPCLGPLVLQKMQHSLDLY